MTEDTKSKIAELEEELYSKEFVPYASEEGFAKKEAIAPPPLWSNEDDNASLLKDKERTEKRHVIMKKFLYISIGFFLLASLAAGFIWWKGGNVISGENITLDTVNPGSVVGGDPFETKFIVTNNNKVSIDAATLYIEFPTGFYSTPGKVALPRISKDVGAILPGQSITENIESILYGEENTQKDVDVVLEYRMSGSNATFKKSITYSIKISSSPINMKVNILKEVTSGQTVEMSIDIQSNSQDTQNNLFLQTDYPIGFTFVSASPMPTQDINIWNLGALGAQKKQTITIRGIIEGQVGESKIMKATLGTQSPTDTQTISLVYNTAIETMVMTKPFLGVDIAINGDSSLEHSVSSGQPVRVDVSWQSNNPTKITDATIEVALKGDALNRYSIYASNGGFYRSSNNTIVWEKTGNPGLASIEPGATGRMSFSFSPTAIGINTGKATKNQQITLEIKVNARRSSDVGVDENVTTFVTRKVNIQTELHLATRGLYFSGPFKNTGPLPPHVGKETTYTIVWTVTNTTNDVSNVSVVATLPAIYMRWLNNFSPTSEDISYNTSSSEITWNVGRMPAGGTREIAFQISFLPSLSQLKSSPTILGASALSGSDDFTKAALSEKKSELRTLIYSDSQFTQNQGFVVE